MVAWAIVLIAAVSGAAALSDNSFLTHVTTGRLILGGDFPHADPYSFTAHGEPWVVQSWFASVLYALTEKVGHGAGTRLLVVVLSGMLGAILWRLSRPARSIVTRLAAVAPSIVVGIVVWGPRPLLFGLIGFAFVLLVLREERDPRWLVPVMWIWVNTHGSFPLGGVLVVAYGLGVWWDKGSLAHPMRTLKWLVVGIALGAINPIGPRLLWFPVELLGKQEVLSFMIEWQAPSFTTLWQRIFLVTILVAVVSIPRLPEGTRYRVLVPALLFTALGLTASRNIALATFVLIPLLAVEFAGVGSLSARARSKVATVGCGTFVMVTLAVVGVRLSEPSYDMSTYPVAASDWLAEHGRLGPSARIASRDIVGNYLEFRTDGTTPVFVDDRVDMFPASIIDDEKTLLSGRPGWHRVLNRWDIDTVLWKEDAALTSLLTVSPDWKLAKRFDGADASTSWVIFERAHSPVR